jgi:DNA-binding CsgD family transcriptional regulator
VGTAVAAIRQSDLQAALDFLREAEAVNGPAPFPPELLERLRRLVPCDLVNYCELDRVQQRLISNTTSTGEYIEDDSDEEGQEFWRLRHQHPACSYQDRTGDFTARKITDFLTRRELRRLELFTEGGRGIFEMGVGLPAPPWHTKVFLFHRGDRDFSERDRQVLDLLRPHLANLYESARKRRLAAALAAGAEVEGELVVLDAGDAIEFATAPARRLLDEYCRDAGGPRLPATVEEWLWSNRRRSNGSSRPTAEQSLTVRNGHRQLVVTPLDGEDRVLLLTEEALPVNGSRPLSYREWQVLSLVEEGKSNAEIAAQLWISPGTARTHLENIYSKLGVHSRTAAVARARTLRRAETG